MGDVKPFQESYSHLYGVFQRGNIGLHVHIHAYIYIHTYTHTSYIKRKPQAWDAQTTLGVAHSNVSARISCVSTNFQSRGSDAVTLTRQWQLVLRFFQLAGDIDLRSPCAYTVAIVSTEHAKQWLLFCSLAGSLDARRVGLSQG